MGKMWCFLEHVNPSINLMETQSEGSIWKTHSMIVIINLVRNQSINWTQAQLKVLSRVE